MQHNNKYIAFIFLATLVLSSGCKKIFDLPEEKDYLSTKISYAQMAYEPILGRTTVFGGKFNADNSSFPMKFEIINPRFGDGRDADDMLTKRDVLVWTAEYTGREESLAEIEAKRKVESRPMVELRASGDVMVWNSASADVLAPRDSIILPQDKRYFDIKITNSGGTRIIKDISLVPWRERPYSPDVDLNPYTGQPMTEGPRSKVLVHIFPGIAGMVGESTGRELKLNDGANGVVYTYIRRVPNGPGNTIRFKFLNKDSAAINPAKFNETKWDRLVHGFNMTMTNEYVQYDVAYPIPVAAIPTRYTSGGINGTGERAFVEFSFSRIGFGGQRAVGRIWQDFQIFSKGDWEIVFHFKTVNPKFENE